jgi:ABC-type antimicrobial peptide transport system permease subunit
MALGAQRKNVLGLVLSETMRPVVIGLGAGLALASMASRLMTSFLFGVSVLDPLAFGGASGFLALVALLAGYVPARRATRVDPMIALRYE